MSRSPEPPESQRPRAGHWLGSFAWAAMCAVAVLYLISLAPTSWQPEWRQGLIDDLSPAATPVADTDIGGETEAALTPAGGSDRKLMVARLDARLAEAEARLTALEQALKQALGPVTSAIPPRHRADVSRADARRPQPAVTIAYRPMPTDGFGDTGLDTVRVPVAASAAPTRTVFAVELARGALATELESAWSALTRTHAPLLERLEPRLAAQDDGLRLIAGPFRNAADAARLCARLEAVGEGCETAVFAGDAF